MWSRTQVFGGVSVSFSLCSGLRLNMVHLGRGLSLVLVPATLWSQLRRSWSTSLVQIIN